MSRSSARSSSQNTGEAVLVSKEDTWTRYFFFFEGGLYKMFLAFNKDALAGKSFQDFGKMMESKYGRAKEVYRDDKVHGGIRHTLDHYEWSAPGGERLRLVDRSEFYGVYCLVLFESGTQDRLAERRKVVNPGESQKDALVEAVTAKGNDDGRDANDDIIDRLTGKEVKKLGDEQKHADIVVPSPGSKPMKQAAESRPPKEGDDQLRRRRQGAFQEEGRQEGKPDRGPRPLTNPSVESKRAWPPGRALFLCARGFQGSKRGGATVAERVLPLRDWAPWPPSRPRPPCEPPASLRASLASCRRSAAVPSSLVPSRASGSQPFAIGCGRAGTRTWAARGTERGAAEDRDGDGERGTQGRSRRGGYGRSRCDRERSQRGGSRSGRTRSAPVASPRLEPPHSPRIKKGRGPRPRPF